MSGQEHTKPEAEDKHPRQEPRSLLVERLYRSHATHLITWLRRKFGDGPPEPEDIAQSTFAKFSGLQSIDHIENFRAFLFTMASNIAVSGIRSNTRTRKLIDAELVESGVEIENITPSRVYESKEAFLRVAKTFETLTERQKEIVIRTRIYEHTYAEIKADKGWSLGTIAADMKSAMQILAEAGDDEEVSSR